MAILMPLLAGAVYTAWIRLFDRGAAVDPVASGRLEA